MSNEVKVNPSPGFLKGWQMGYDWAMNHLIDGGGYYTVSGSALRDAMRSLPMNVHGIDAGFAEGVHCATGDATFGRR